MLHLAQDKRLIPHRCMFAACISNMCLCGLMCGLTIPQVVLEVIEEQVARGSRIYESGHFVVLVWGNSQRDLEAVERILSQVQNADQLSNVASRKTVAVEWMPAKCEHCCTSQHELALDQPLQDCYCQARAGLPGAPGGWRSCGGRHVAA